MKPKLISKYLNCKIILYVFVSVIFVAKATSLLILQSLLFLNHVMEKLHSEHDVMNLLTKLQTY